MHSLPFRTADELDEFLTRPTAGVRQAVAQVPGDFAILGAGGKLGFHVCWMLQRALQAAGRSDRVLAISRFGSPESRRPFERAGIETLSADLTTPGVVEKLPDARNVFYLAVMKFGTADNPQLLEDMNVRTPARVAGRYRASRIVALSTGNVYSYAAPASRGPTESGETQPPGSYGRSCLRKERAFIDASREFGTPGAIIRLNYAIGIRYGVLNDIARRVLAEEPVSLEAGYVNVIWQGDAVAHILQALPATASPPVILNVTGPEVLRVRDVAEQFARRFGTTAMFSGTEPETALLSNAGKSHQLFGPPQVGIEELLDWTAQWLRQGGETLNKPTHFEVRSGEF